MFSSVFYFFFNVAYTSLSFTSIITSLCYLFSMMLLSSYYYKTNNFTASVLVMMIYNIIILIEKEIYNGALSGMALDGTHYFYVNPLEVNPSESAKNPDKKHVLPRRQAWFGTACCPSNITRLIASMDRYLYEVKDNNVQRKIAGKDHYEILPTENAHKFKIRKRK